MVDKASDVIVVGAGNAAFSALEVSDGNPT